MPAAHGFKGRAGKSNVDVTTAVQPALSEAEGAMQGRLMIPTMEKKISVVLIGVTDMDRAVRFYREVLGIPLKFQSDTYTEFATHGAVLALERRKEVLSSGPAFTFPTTDIRQDRERLEEAGVKFWQDLREEDFGWVLMPHDSEGNIFEVVQYKK